jgi:hypothetical protein
MKVVIRLKLYLLMALVFACTIAGEWAISREIYEVLVPGQAWVLFLLCVGVGLWISACLVESSDSASGRARPGNRRG